MTQVVDFELPTGCRHPREVASGGALVLAGCGQCYVCRRKRRQQWVGRSLLELEEKGVGLFLTLTYAPDQDEASYRDVQLFAKRVRRNNPEWDLSYIARGELGERFGRFHWHVLAFGWRELWNGLVDLEEWPHGHVHTGELNASSAAYLYGYTMKDSTWGETRYSSRPCIGYAGMMRIAAALSEASQYAICPGNFSVGGTRYPMGYHMKQTIEARMVELGCIEVPPMNADQLFDQVVEYRRQVAAGAYGFAHRQADAARLKAGTRERKAYDGDTLQGHRPRTIEGPKRPALPGTPGHKG